MPRTKEQVLTDVKRDVNRIMKKAFISAMTTEFLLGDGSQTPEEYAAQHIERMSTVFAKESEDVVDVIYNNINDYQSGQGVDGVI